MTEQNPQNQQQGQQSPAPYGTGQPSEPLAAKQQPPPQQPLPQPASQQGGPPPQQGGFAAPPQPEPKPQNAPVEQTLTYLKREDVHTMEKDIARFREQEARNERERIVQLQAQKQAEREKEVVEKIRAMAQEKRGLEETRQRQSFQKIQESILPPGQEQRVQRLPSPPSSTKKVLVRLIIVFFIAFVAFNAALFGYSKFVKEKSPQLFEPERPSPQAPTTTPTPPQQPQAPPQKQAASLSDLFKAESLATIEFSNTEELLLLLSQLSTQEHGPGFTEIILARGSESDIVRKTAVLGLFEVPVPSSVASGFQDDALFFLHAYEGRNRFGLIIKIQDRLQTLEALKAWEPTMEKDLAPIDPIWDARGAGYTTLWRSKTPGDRELRFQTFSLQDTGIVYAFVDNYLIFASSYEATRAVIEKLRPVVSLELIPQVVSVLGDFEAPQSAPAMPLEQMVGQVLLMGFEGTSLTPELETLLQTLQPGGVLLLAKNIQSAAQLKKLTQDLQTVSLRYSSSPLFIAVDQEGGLVSRIGFGKEKTPQSFIQTAEHAYEVGKQRGLELKDLGVNLNLSPVLDASEPPDFLFQRTFQAENVQAGNLAKSLLAGQKASGIFSALKHFPGYGSISFNPEGKLAVAQEFPDISPFIFALSAQPEFLLVSNVIYPAIDEEKPFSFSEQGISMIRSELGFSGIILSDDLAQPALLENYSLRDIALFPLRGGVDMIMFSQEKYAKEARDILLQEAREDPGLLKHIERVATKIQGVKQSAFSPTDAARTLTEHLSKNN